MVLDTTRTKPSEPHLAVYVKPLCLGLALLFLVAAGAIWVVRYNAVVAAGALAIDYRSFVDEGHRMLTAGTPYLPYQLSGPYTAYGDPPRLDPATVPFLYPPPFVLVCVALALLSNLSSALGFVWWAVPIGLIGYAIWRLRPAPWTWPIMALCLAWPATGTIVAVGGSSMWVAAMVAAGLLWRWPSAFILLKPSFLPLALIGIRSRGWWITAIALGVLSLPLLGQYVTAVRNVTDVSLTYSFTDIPLVLLPVVAWLGHAPGVGEARRHRGGRLPEPHPDVLE